jgi:hypothetical protein
MLIFGFRDCSMLESMSWPTSHGDSGAGSILGFSDDWFEVGVVSTMAFILSF